MGNVFFSLVFSPDVYVTSDLELELMNIRFKRSNSNVPHYFDQSSKGVD